MSFSVTIEHNGKCFIVERGESILAAARRQGVDIPYGCSEGICGACMYTLVMGGVEYPDGQPFALSEEDMTAGKGLCCVGYPSADIVIALDHPDEDFEPWI